MSLKEGEVTEGGAPKLSTEPEHYVFTHDACQHLNYQSSLSLSMDERVFPPWVSPVRQSVLSPVGKSDLHLEQGSGRAEGQWGGHLVDRWRSQ